MIQMNTSPPHTPIFCRLSIDLSWSSQNAQAICGNCHLPQNFQAWRKAVSVFPNCHNFFYKDCIDPEKQKPFNTVLKTISYVLYYTQPFRQNFPLAKEIIHLLHNPDLFQLILLLFPLATLSLCFPVHWSFFAFLFSWSLFVVQLPGLILCRKWVNKTLMTLIHDITAIYHVMIYLCVSLLSSLTLTSSSTVLLAETS